MATSKKPPYQQLIGYIPHNGLTTNDPINKRKTRVGGGFVNKKPQPQVPNKFNPGGTVKQNQERLTFDGETKIKLPQGWTNYIKKITEKRNNNNINKI